MMKKKNEMTPVGQTNYWDQTDNIQTNKQTNHHRKEWWAKPDSGKCQFALRTSEKGGQVLKPYSWFNFGQLSFSQCIMKSGKRTFDSQASSFICLQPKIIEPVWEEGGDCYQVRRNQWLWSSNLKPFIFVQTIIIKLIIIVQMWRSPILILHIFIINDYSTS